MIQNRIKFLDDTKAVGIILMIVGHCYWKDSVPYLNSLIYSFHMPLFFIISGFFLKEIDICMAIRKYGKSYIIPYCFTMLICIGIIAVISIINDDQSLNHLYDWLIRFSFGSGSDKGNELFANVPIVGPLWFLLALFWAVLIYSVAKKYLNEIDFFAFILFMFVFSYLSVKLIRFPLSIQAGMSACMFLYVGEFIRKFDFINKLDGLTMIGGFFGLSIWGVCVSFGSMSLSHCVYGLGLINIVGSVIASLFVLISMKTMGLHKMGGVIGQHTLSILCAHQIVLYVIMIYGNPFKGLPFVGIVNLLIESFIQILAALFIARLLTLTPYINKYIK